MNSELIELGRRAVACEVWRWMEGMKTLSTDRTWPMRLISDSAGTNNPDSIYVGCSLGLAVPTCGDDLPDLYDPATLGCLLALVREVYGEPVTTSCRDDAAEGNPDMWMAWCPSRGSIGEGPTEAHALVAALESSPNRA